jgi:hypothetical protein
VAWRLLAAGSGDADEESVDLAVSNYQSNFHAAYWHEYDICYTSAPVTAPPNWSSPATVVNEINWASHDYVRPTSAEAAIAWTDWRGPIHNYEVYFDSPGISSLLPFIPLLLFDE